MKVIETRIQGLVIVELDVFEDSRGSFGEVYNQAKYQAAGIKATFVQGNLSVSKKGVLRGLHSQFANPQAKLVTCVHGEIFDVAVDLRPDSPTFGSWFGLTLSQYNRRQLYIPKDLAHGFLVLSDSARVAYSVDAYYTPGAEFAIRWDDPDLGIDWPRREGLIISDRDQAGMSFAEFRARL